MKSHIKYINILIFLIFTIGIFPFIVSSQGCETKEECVRESIEQKRKMIESGEIPTETDSTHEYTYNVEYNFMVSDGDTVWNEIRNTHDELTPDTLDQWFENERIAVLDALKKESSQALRVMGFSSGSIDLIYPKDIICFKALHRNKRVIEKGNVIEDSDIIYDIESCK